MPEGVEVKLTSEEVQQRTEDAYSNPNMSWQERENAIHGMQIHDTGELVANKGALVTKPKRKAAPKKRTTKKGLGVKTKAT